MGKIQKKISITTRKDMQNKMLFKNVFRNIILFLSTQKICNYIVPYQIDYKLSHSYKILNDLIPNLTSYLNYITCNPLISA